VQTAVRLERQHLDEGPGLPQAPGPVVDRGTIDDDREAAEQANSDSHLA
jgi:hypothetical protein